MHHSSPRCISARTATFVLGLLFSTYCAAGDIEAGKVKAMACSGCHGAQGIAVAQNFPNLAGQKEVYLVAAIQAYRSGKRNDPTMNVMVGSLTDDEVANLAAYFSSLPGK